MIPIIIIAGPTAVGKTALAIRLAQQLNTDIISVDSMQVYQQMNIGTAKPSQEEQRQVKHHLIDLAPPDQTFSVADYQPLFNAAVEQLAAQGKVPLIVGGTGLYIRACTQGFTLDNPADANPQLRAELTLRAELEGNLALHQQLTQVDPTAAAAIHPNDLRRIIRALEVFLTTGIPISGLQKKDTTRYAPIYLFLDRDRAELYQRIEARVEQMLAEGLVEEVCGLRSQGYSPALKAMQSLGYKQINDYLDGRSSFEQAVTELKQKTRNYAKRQLTWFNREPVDWKTNLSGKSTEFNLEIFHYLEGRLNQTSNKTL